MIIIKRTDDAGNWWMYDSSRGSINPNGTYLYSNLSNVETTDVAEESIDFLSNGFKLRMATYQPNTSGATFIGFAWAESPFQTANSK